MNIGIQLNKPQKDLIIKCVPAIRKSRHLRTGKILGSGDRI